MSPARYARYEFFADGSEELGLDGALAHVTVANTLKIAIESYVRPHVMILATNGALSRNAIGANTRAVGSRAYVSRSFSRAN